MLKLGVANVLALLLFTTVAMTSTHASSVELERRGLISPIVDNASYEALCGAGSDSKHICFTHWYGSINNAVVEFPTLPYLTGGKNMVNRDSSGVGELLADPRRFDLFALHRLTRSPALIPDQTLPLWIRQRSSS